MKPIFLCLFLAWSLAGCTANRQERQVSHQFGIKDGMPTDLTTTTETKEATSSGVDVAALVSAAVQASQGKILGALDAIKPQPLPEIPSLGAITNAVTAIQKPPGTDWGLIGTSLIATIMAAIAAQKTKEAKMHRSEKEEISKDRDKAWDDLVEANRQLPPK